MDPIVRSNQAGFRSDISCAQLVRHPQKDRGEFPRLPTLTVTFIDFKKALHFQKGHACRVAALHGIPDSAVNVISAIIYNNSKRAVMWWSMGTFRILLMSPLVFKSTSGRFSPIPIHYLSRFPHEEMHSRSCFWSLTHPLHPLDDTQPRSWMTWILKTTLHCWNCLDLRYQDNKSSRRSRPYN